MDENKLSFEIDSKPLDEVIEKANRLVLLLREAEMIINSLSQYKKLKT